MSHAEKCPVCNGTGKLKKETCHGCSGRGWVPIDGNDSTFIPHPQPYPYAVYPKSHPKPYSPYPIEPYPFWM